MKLLLKIFGYTAAVLFSLIVVAFISLQLITNEQYKKWITAATESATGRVLSIDGEFDLSLSTKISLAAHDVRFANAAWGSRSDMASLDRLLVEVRLLPLFTGVLDLVVEADGPDVLLETDAAGSGNWVFAAGPETINSSSTDEIQAPEEESSFSLPLKPYIRNLQITELVFAYGGASDPKNIEATVEQFRIFVDGSDLPLLLKGSYQGAPIDLHGSLGSIEQWHNNQKTALSLAGSLNEANLNVTGFAGPMLPRPEVRLDVDLTAGSVSTFDAFAGVTLPRLENIDLSFTVAADDGALSLENLQADLDDQHLRGALTGRIDDLVDVSGIEMNTEVSTEKGDDLAGLLNLGPAFSVPRTIELTGGVGGSLDALSIDGLELRVRDQGLDVLLTADLNDVLDSMGGNADLAIDLESTSIITRHTGLDLPAFGPLKGSARVVSASSALQIESLHLELSDPILVARVEGSAGNIITSGEAPFQISGIELNGTAESGKLEEIIERFGVAVPVELPNSIDLDVAAAGSLDKLGITSLEVTVKDSGVDVNLNGTIDNVIEFAGIAAELRAAIQDSAGLSKYTGVDIPALGSMGLQAKISSKEDTYAVDDLELTLDGDSVTAKINGKIADLLALTGVAQNQAGYGESGINADFALQTPSLSALLREASGIEMEELGALDMNGHVISTAESISLDSLQASLTNQGVQTTLEGAVQDLLGMSGLRAEIQGEVDSLSSLTALAGTELPKTGNWSFNVRAESLADTPDGLNFSSELGGEGIAASIVAQVSDLKTFQTFQSELQVTVDSFGHAASLFDYKVIKDTTLKLDGRLNGEPGVYRLEEFLITTDKGEIRADLAYQFPPHVDLKRPRIDGKLDISGLDISPFLTPEEKTEQAARETGGEGESTDTAPETEVAEAGQGESDRVEEKSATGKKIFSDEPFSVSWLNNYDVDLELHAADILFPKGTTGDAEIHAVLEGGRLRIDPINLSESSGGAGNGYILLDAVTETAVLDSEIDLDNFASPRFGGTIDLHLDLDGEGSSVASLMGSLNGYFAASLNDLEMERSYLSQFGAGLLKQLNPLDSEKTLLECGVVRFDIVDGVADFNNKIAAQTTEVTWLGGGEINLKTEELDLGISPKPRGAISSLTNVDLASLVHIGGTLGAPRIGIDLADVAYKYAGYTAFFATGGLSFLAQKVVDTARANADQCERILGELEDKGSDPDMGSDPEKINDQPATEETGGDN